MTWSQDRSAGTDRSAGSRQVVGPLVLLALPPAVGCARAFARAALRARVAAHEVDDALLIVSELVTNAVRAARLDLAAPRARLRAEHLVGVQLRLVGASLYVEVWDGSPEEPVTGQPTDDAESGRGLRLVEAVAGNRGCCHPSAGGKIVWSRLALSIPLGIAAPPAPPDLGVRDDVRAPHGPARRHVHAALLTRLGPARNRPRSTTPPTPTSPTG